MDTKKEPARAAENTFSVPMNQIVFYALWGFDSEGTGIAQGNGSMEHPFRTLRNAEFFRKRWNRTWIIEIPYAAKPAPAPRS